MTSRSEDWWHAFFMRLCTNMAQASKDPDGQVGALLVSPDRRDLHWGYNGFPSGYPDTPENYARNRDLIIHAERNAILKAGRVAGWTLYVSKHPCLPCSLDVAQAGIKTVVCPSYRLDGTWGSSQLHASMFLAAQGIRCLQAPKAELVQL